MAIVQALLPSDMEAAGYLIFDPSWENDPKVLFHGTSSSSYPAISSGGFKSAVELGTGDLHSVSFAKRSSIALYHWCNRRMPGEDGIIIAVRYSDTSLLKVENDVVYDYRRDPQPTIIGFCGVLHTYQFV